MNSRQRRKAYRRMPGIGTAVERTLPSGITTPMVVMAYVQSERGNTVSTWRVRTKHRFQDTTYLPLIAGLYAPLPYD
ncbi:hypothetical protein ACS7SF_09985 [Ralstonia sp. 25C]|uniref:hypothetical protein n=1 Tax=Ralstonia sp. 25C TaxID=3447363 RepID=UPI003F74DFDB